MYSRKVQILLALSGSSIIFGGTLFLAGSREIPYGHLAGFVFLLMAGVSALPFAIAIRSFLLARKLMRVRTLTHRPDGLPKRSRAVYLGEGFSWNAAETSNLLDLTLKGVSLPEDKTDAIAGDWLIHGVGAGKTRNLFLPEHLLNQHLFLLGAPGSGKTRALEVLIEQAVARGEAVVVIDPKGDEGLLDRTYDAAHRHGRGDAFRLMALPYPYRSARYNPLGDFISANDIADRIASVLPRGGDNEPFRNFAWEFVYKVAAGMHLLGDTITLTRLENNLFHNLPNLITRLMRKQCPNVPQSPDMEATLEAYKYYCDHHRDFYPELDALIDLHKMDKRNFGNVSGSLRTVLTKLTTQSVGYLLCPGDVNLPEGMEDTGPAQVISWEAIDRNRLVVYFFLGSLIGQDSASATARMCLADLASYVGRKYAFEEAESFKENRLTVIVDEVADAAAAESVNILNKARGAGLSLTFAGQSLADLEVALGGRAEARRALANIGTFLTFRTANPDDAAFFTEKVGKRPIPVRSTGERYEPALFASGRKNIADFSYQSSTQTTTRTDYLLPASVLDRLARFHYFGHWGGELRKGLLPLLTPPGKRISLSLKRPAASPEPPGTEVSPDPVVASQPEGNAA